MSSFWRALVVLVLALPVGAYVAGSAMDERAELPDRRPAVVLDDPAGIADQTSPSATPTGSGDDRDERDDDSGPGGDIETVMPDPEEVRDELEDRREDRQDAAEDAADDRRDAREDRRDELDDARDDAADDGHDGSGDDHSGPGGGDDSGSDSGSDSG